MTSQHEGAMGADAQSASERVKARLRKQLATLLNGVRGTPEANRQRELIREHLHVALRELSGPEYRALQISRGGEESRFLQDILDEAVGRFGPLDPLLADPSVSEIMVNGPFQIFVERGGMLQRVEGQFTDARHLMTVMERLLGDAGTAVSESNPVCDARLPDGSRMNVIIPPLALNGPVITIRRSLSQWTMADYLHKGSVGEQTAQFLEACIRAKVNLVISGGTSTGKTTLVNLLSSSIPSSERVITIENVPELELPGREHWVRLVARAANFEGRGEIPLRVLVKNALRMRPDRIILGEARGGEALDVVQAMHSGHDGFMTVLHANSPQAALERLETLMLMSGVDVPPSVCRTQIASAVDLVVHMARFIDGSRRVAAISQVQGSGGSTEGFQLEDLFTFEVQGFSPDGQLHGTCRYTGATPKFLSKFQLNNVEVPSWVTTG